MDLDERASDSDDRSVIIGERVLGDCIFVWRAVRWDRKGCLNRALTERVTACFQDGLDGVDRCQYGLTLSVNALLDGEVGPTREWTKAVQVCIDSAVVGL